MLEVMKDVALSIAVIGFGLAVLLPGVINVFQIAGVNSYYERNIFINIGWLLIVSITTILYAFYYVISFYFIWW
ncbi:membrane protein [Pectobacterium phage vB_PcaM_CBB]|uniref:Putative membrane protein n=1 Tax=Pectobacterium phage vB_PcaM_CBB TaxID=2772511 RepID=A0A1L2CUJ1_9CAUD|nr:membrane protein [Pectobacterium phage vB_PcaM_CBB]AMM43681.1 putative membrane protein [Pectobacterium phage vB_PcaM_CBB]